MRGDVTLAAGTHLGMQFGEDPSISHVANRFMGTGLLSAPLPGKLNRPLLSAMVRAAAAGWDCPTPSWRFIQQQTGAGLLDARARAFVCVCLCVCARVCVSVEKAVTRSR